jgi:ubiquitin-protein ligase
MFATAYKPMINNLDKIFAAMRNGKYHCVIDPKGNACVGIINGVMREDGSGKKWIVTVTTRTVSTQVFIHAS